MMNMCNRRDERYLEDDHEPGSVPNPNVKKSRFLKKERKVELSYKDQVEEPAAPEVPRRRRKEVFLPVLPNSHYLLQTKPLPELKEPVAEEKNTEVRPIGEAKLNLIFYPYFPDALKYREAKLNLIF